MAALDRLIPRPRLVEIDRVDVAAPQDVVWQRLRHGELAPSRLARALFAIRTALSGREAPKGVLMDDLRSTPETPGFQILVDEPPHEVAVGAIGQVWKLDIPFVHVADADAYADFRDAGNIKVAWVMRATARGSRETHVELELRVDATDDDAWRRFRRYFAIIGPASRWIRKTALHALARELGAPQVDDNARPLPGDELVPDAKARFTHAIDIAATPDRIWPWLLQLGCNRGGFYSIDVLDNAGERSARELHPDLQELRVGDAIDATPKGDATFEVLRVEAPRVLTLGGLYDRGRDTQLRFHDERPERFWHVTWSFVLEPLDERSTRLYARARGAFSPSERLRSRWIGPVHHLMQTAQLRHLAQRAEERLPRDDARDVLEGLRGVATMAVDLATPFLRSRRSHRGLDEKTAARRHPGDELVPEPRWSWTHAIEIDAPAAEVWPWIAQIGADRGGFYSYQWLENVAGCGLRNAERIHPEWEVREGGGLVVHPNVPPLRIVGVEPGRWFVAQVPTDERARAEGRPWIAATWLFMLEPLGRDRCRFISRYRAATSNDLATRLAFGPTLVEPIGAAMDRQMLRGVKERAERASALKHAPPPRAPAPPPEARV